MSPSLLSTALFELDTNGTYFSKAKYTLLHCLLFINIIYLHLLLALKSLHVYTYKHFLSSKIYSNSNKELI